MSLQTTRTKLPKAIKRITILNHDPGSTALAVAQPVVIERKRKRKKQSKGLMRILERLARTAARVNQSTATSYLERHQRSNQKRRDGWLRDYPYNWVKANRKGNKKFKISKLFD